MTPSADRPYFAAFLDLRGRPGIVVGGGAVAASKVETLLRSDVRVTVISPDLCVRLSELATLGAIKHEARRFQPGDLLGAEIAIAATDDASANEAVANSARALRIPVNVADDASRSTFIMPALVDRAPIQIAISTAGASPLLARKLRGIIEAAVPFTFGRLAVLAARFREAAKNRIADRAARHRFWDRVMDGPIAEEVLAGEEDKAAQMLEQALDSGPPPPAGKVYLVGIGPANPESLTMRGLRVLQMADVVLYDHRASRAVLDLARREAEKVNVTHEEAVALALREARAGKRVVWLRDGDPVQALGSQGIALEDVPGLALQEEHAQRSVDTP